MTEVRKGTSKDPAARRGIWIRLIVSPLVLILVVGVLWLHDRTDRPLPTDLLLFLAGAGAAFELARVFAQGGLLASPRLAALASGLLAGVGVLAPHEPLLRMELRALLPFLFLTALLVAHLKDLRRDVAAGIAATVTAALFIGLPLGLVREVGLGPLAARWLVYVLVVAKASDIGGWLVGVPFGRHKLIPSVSPGKSWEGLFGGLLLSVVAALVLAGPLGLPAASWSVAKRTLFGLSLGLASVLAGLLHSGWKRRFGVKDSSPLIPEIGGMLDMVDSMVLAAPMAWLWFRMGWA